ncbi:MAG: aminoacetone oxidase family FAD-binding enzyme [Firmicutes bacterium]|nr:aminoacetone oxidase family FAD-binding enzyme [Bacillota bacterium]
MKIAIIGGGAAGLMCACLMSSGHSVTLFEKNESVGKKLLLTGNGRCNLTNLTTPGAFLKSVPNGNEFLSPAIHSFTPNDTIKFFEEIGIQTRVEDKNRIFPTTGGAMAIKKALENLAESRGVKFMLYSNVTNITKAQSCYELSILNENYIFDAIIIATGGMSFPTTGSTGDGFVFAETFGHKIIPVRPSLCGLRFETSTGFQGISIECTVTLDDIKETGSMMFTKNGVSGPVIFKLSSMLKGQSVAGKEIVIDFVPHIDKPTFDSKDKPFFAFRKYLPQNVANWLVARGDKPTSIKKIRIPIKDFEPIETATITRGGVDLHEINPENMESKLNKDMFFIGEVLNIDALSGGFNLQIAFSTAHACAKYLNELYHA